MEKIEEPKNLGTVLVVDDTPDNLTLLAEILKSSGYRVFLFPEGSMALHSLEKILPDVVLLDISMPGINGYEICRRMKSNPLYRDIPILFISSFSGTEEKLQAFSVGGVDYITKPFNSQEVIARVSSHIRIRLLQKKIEAQLQEQRMELQWAGEMQKAMLHAENIKSDWVESQSVWQPLEGMYCSGDYFDIVKLSPEKYLVLLGDVAGHGVKAAFITGVLKAIIYPEYIRRTIGKEFSPASFLTWLNQRMNFELRKTNGILITFFAGLVDQRASSFLYANAGQNYPYQISHGRTNSLACSGPALGVLDTPAYKNTEVGFSTEDLFFFYTDGLVEAGSKTMDQNSCCLENILERIPYGEMYPQRVLTAVLNEFRCKNFDDDVTIVTLKIK